MALNLSKETLRNLSGIEAEQIVIGGRPIHPALRTMDSTVEPTTSMPSVWDCNPGPHC